MAGGFFEGVGQYFTHRQSMVNRLELDKVGRQLATISTSNGDERRRYYETVFRPKAQGILPYPFKTTGTVAQICELEDELNAERGRYLTLSSELIQARQQAATLFETLHVLCVEAQKAINGSDTTEGPWTWTRLGLPGREWMHHHIIGRLVKVRHQEAGAGLQAGLEAAEVARLKDELATAYGKIETLEAGKRAGKKAVAEASHKTELAELALGAERKKVEVLTAECDRLFEAFGRNMLATPEPISEGAAATVAEVRAATPAVEPEPVYTPAESPPLSTRLRRPKAQKLEVVE